MEGEEFLNLPPGFRFSPSDEELIVHYLENKVNFRSVPASIVGEIELYKFSPWELPRKKVFGADELFFFSPRDRKYPNGSRPKRSAGSGFWKAMGKDKPIYASLGSKKIGVKKALAFFKGSPTKNIKTNWTMSEYRLLESSNRSSGLNGSMRLDDWVLCRVRQKGNKSKNKSDAEENPKILQLPIITTTAAAATPPTQELPSSYMITNTNIDIISDPRFKDFQLMASILSGHDVPHLIQTSSPKLLQSTKTRDTNSQYYENGPLYKETASFMMNDDMLTSDDSYDVLDTIHMDVVMKLIKDG
ncbi:hypothetical protein L2E82_05196 [Cichorium intybus]|uniref:Uncharacterized protein n=1 Tax=Cichorium intybus TaxID=13427 RepID=A0ACB9H8Z7_CICIN|nr:hypothetical protein L2E82_05196 [Cichorium intybus]